MATRLGFFAVLGIFIAPVAGMMLESTIPSTFLAIGGLFVGLAVGFLLDKLAEKKETSAE